MHPSPEAHGPVGRSRRFGALPRSLLESCRVTPAPGRPGRDSARRLPLGRPYAQQAQVPASGSRRALRHTQRNAARAQFWLGAEFVALRLKRSFSLCAAPQPTMAALSLSGPGRRVNLLSRWLRSPCSQGALFLSRADSMGGKNLSTTDAGSLNTFGRNEIEVAPISSALLRIACLVILYKTCVPDQELAADGVSEPV